VDGVLVSFSFCTSSIVWKWAQFFLGQEWRVSTQPMCHGCCP
jgi:hypothetical protein